MKLIPKDAVLAEIDKMFNKHSSKHDIDEAGVVLLELRDNIEPLEVKEMNLDEETLHSELRKIYASVYDNKDIKAAKHFFELGLQANNPLTWEDMMTIHKCCKDAMNYNLYAWETAEGQQKIYEEVLKRFKKLI